MLSVSTVIARGDDLAVFEQMLASVSFADELVIFNMERDDQEAVALCKKYQARVIAVKTPPIVEYIRGEQLRSAQYPWVLIVDFDEVIPASLKEEILSISDKPEPGKIGAYFIKRRNYSLGYPLHHGGWGDDQVVRLLNRAAFVSWPAEIHTLPRINGVIGHLSQAMEHHKDQSLAQMVDKTNRYSAVEAQQFFAGGLPSVTPLTLFRKSVMEFLRRYFFKLGLLDGRIGLIQSLYQSYSVFITYAKLSELQSMPDNQKK